MPGDKGFHQSNLLYVILWFLVHVDINNALELSDIMDYIIMLTHVSIIII